MKRKRCSKCTKLRLLKFFSKRSSRPCGVQSRCKECFRPYSAKAYKKRDKAAARAGFYKWYRSTKGKAYLRRLNARRRGLTAEQVEGILKQQKNRCAVCRKRFTGTPRIDHNHKNNKVRGLLCSNCNTALGMLREHIGICKRLINYIRHWRRKHECRSSSVKQ